MLSCATERASPNCSKSAQGMKTPTRIGMALDQNQTTRWIIWFRIALSADNIAKGPLSVRRVTDLFTRRTTSKLDEKLV